MTQLITVDEVKAACRKAYTEKRLIAQDPKPSVYGYQILGSYEVVRVCAIGAVLNDEAIKIICEKALQWCTISNPKDGMSGEDIISAFHWDETEKEDLMEIQLAHDEWLGNVRDDEYPSISEREFKRVIGL